MNEPPHYPMLTLEQARASMKLAEKDHRAGVLSDFAYADVRAMLHDAMQRFENEAIKRTFVQPGHLAGMRFTNRG